MKPKPKVKVKSTLPRTKKSMEPIQTKKETSSVPQTKQRAVRSKVWLIVGGIVVVVLVAGSLSYWYRYKAQPAPAAPEVQSPMVQLEQLETQSKPVTTTPKQQMTTLKQVEKSSKPVKTTRTQQLSELQQLEAGSH